MNLRMSPLCLLFIALNFAAWGCGESTGASDSETASELSAAESCSLSCTFNETCNSENTPEDCPAACQSMLESMPTVCTTEWSTISQCLDGTDCNSIESCMSDVFSEQCAQEQSRTVETSGE